jgi:3-oxosteroid 1-dehydrogenase
MLDLLREKGLRVFRPKAYPDYHALAPGASLDGRALMLPPFDKRRLGAWEERVFSGPDPLGLKIQSDEFAGLVLARRTMSGKGTVAKVIGRTLWGRLTRKNFAVRGGSLISRLLEIALRNDVPIWTESPMVELWVEGDRVVGVVAEREGEQVRIRADRGVVLASGGFTHSQELRDRFARKPTDAAWGISGAGSTGDWVKAAESVGAAFAHMEDAWYITVSIIGGMAAPQAVERVLPHSIVVDSTGSRFANEATDFVAFGQAMYERNKTVPAIPAWLIIDTNHRNHYPFLISPPGKTPDFWIESGYMKKADTLEALAAACEIDAAGLKQTVERFNKLARAGHDDDFNRGDNPADRYFGDPKVTPNPTLGEVSKPPFYAVAFYPGDVGTCGGMKVNEHAQVLREDGTTIQGLYAAGDNTAPLFAGADPGGGVPNASAMTFGYIAAKAIAGESEPAEASLAGSPATP